MEISTNLSLEEAERRHILGALQKSGWRIAGRGGAAEILDFKRTHPAGEEKKIGYPAPHRSVTIFRYFCPYSDSILLTRSRFLGLFGVRKESIWWRW
jgi:hypothetical protein